MSPKRIQRKRTPGWRMPKGAVYVGRPTKWGNPYLATNGREAAIARFRREFEERPELQEIARRELAGLDLACWCALDQPCHADVLLEFANADPQRTRAASEVTA